MSSKRISRFALAARLFLCALLATLLGVLAVRQTPTALAQPDETGDGDEVVTQSEDLTGDAVVDTVTASPDGDGSGASTAGQVDIASGSDGATATFKGNEEGDKFGQSVALVGPDANGINHLLIGAPNESGNGRAYFFTGPFTYDAGAEVPASEALYVLQSDFTPTDGTTVVDYAFGHRVGPLFDVDGDAVLEMRVASMWNKDGVELELMHVFSGATAELLFVTIVSDTFDPWAELPSDLNADGLVDQTDVDLMLEAVATGSSLADPTLYDLNGDGNIDALDVALVLDSIGLVVLHAYLDGDGDGMGVFDPDGQKVMSYFRRAPGDGCNGFCCCGPPADCGACLCDCRPCPELPCAPPGPCSDSNPCSADCADRDCKPECGGDPCSPDCPNRDCNPACGGDPCSPDCVDSGFPCNDPCAGDPCGPNCPDAPCNPACGGDPCSSNCPDAPCNPDCGGGPCAPGCVNPPCQHLEDCDDDDDPEYACVGEEKILTAPVCPLACQQGCEPGEWQWDFGDPGDELIAEIITDPPTGETVIIRFNDAGAIDLVADNGCCRAEIDVAGVKVDLDIDSDNNNGYDPPDGSDDEDDVEDGAPGKIVLANTGDFDDDGVPDFADGIDIFGNFWNNSSHGFAPISLELSGLPTDEEATLRFTYSASPPTLITRITDSFGDFIYSPASGQLRLWARDGSEARQPQSIVDGGDFIESDVEYSLQELMDGESGITIFVEPIFPSESAGDQQISVELLIAGHSVCADTIRLTTLPRVYLAFNNGDTVQLAGMVLKPVYTDGVSAEGDAYAGVLSGDEKTLYTGSNGPHPNAGPDLNKDIESFRILVETESEVYLAIESAPVLLTVDEDPDEFYQNVNTNTLSNGTSGDDSGDWIDPDPSDLDPDGFEAEFEIMLEDKYSSAEPSIEWLEREAWELRGIIYGGTRQEWDILRNPDVWRDDNLIYVEDSLTPEEAADEYYAYLNELVGPGSEVPLTQWARYVGEIENLNDELFFNGNRARVGEWLGEHWGLVDMLATDLEMEVYTVGAGFVIGGVMDLARARNIRFRTGPRMEQPAWPLVRRNWARGKWVEHDTIENSLLRSRNIGSGQHSFTHAVDGVGPVTFKPDGVYSQSFLEVKDVISLERIRQIRAMAGHSALPTVNKRFVLICTSRTKKMTGPLKAMMKQAPPTDAPHATRHLLRRNVNQDTYEEWVFSNNLDPAEATTPQEFAEAVSGEWVTVPKSHVQGLLGP